LSECRLVDARDVHRTRPVHRPEYATHSRPQGARGTRILQSARTY
jgi:hypothetical protein